MQPENIVQGSHPPLYLNEVKEFLSCEDLTHRVHEIGCSLFDELFLRKNWERRDDHYFTALKATMSDRTIYLQVDPQNSHFPIMIWPEKKELSLISNRNGQFLLEKFTHGKEWNYEQIADERVIRSLAQRWLIPEDMRWDIRREWKPYVIAMFGSWEVFEQLEVASGEEDFDRLLFDVSRDMEKGGSLTDDLQDRFHNCTHMRRNPLKLCNLDFVRGYAKKMRELFHKKRCWILSDEERPEFPQLLWVEKQEIHLLRVQLGGDGFFYERLRKNYRDDTRREVSQAEVQSLIQNRFGKGGHSLPQLHLPHIAHPTLSTSVKSNIKSAGHAVKTVAKGVGRVTLDILDALGDIDFGDD